MGRILEINGPLVRLELPQTMIGEQVRVGEMKLVGEVISREQETALAQMYENTEGLRPGESAEGLGYPLSVELGPGLIGTIFDGIQRPLEAIRALSGDHIARGIEVASLNRDRRWAFLVPNVWACACGAVKSWAPCRKRPASSTASLFHPIR
jgi:V/A-type H+-transporting ATPase subunit A